MALLASGSDPTMERQIGQNYLPIYVGLQGALGNALTNVRVNVYLNVHVNVYVNVVQVHMNVHVIIIRSQIVTIAVSAEFSVN